MIIIGLAETNHSLSWSSWLKNTSHKFTDIHDHHWIGWNQSFLIMIIMAKKYHTNSLTFMIIIGLAETNHSLSWSSWLKKHHTNSLTFMIIIGLAETNHSLSWSSWLKKHHTNSLTFMIIIGLAETNHSLSWSSWLKKTSHKFTDIHDHHWIGWNQSFLIMIIMAKKHHTNSLTFMIIIGLAETNHSLSWSSWLKQHHTNSLTFMIIIGLAETNHSLSWSPWLKNTSQKNHWHSWSSLDWLKPISLSWSSWLKNTSHKFTDIHDHHWIGWNQSFLIMIIMAKKTSHKFTDIHDHHWIGWNQSFLIMIIIGLAETNHSLSWSSWLKKHHTNSLTFMIIIGLAETNHSLSWSSWLKKHHTNSLTFMIIIGLAETNHSLSWSSWLKNITQIHWHSWSSLDWRWNQSFLIMIIIGLAETLWPYDLPPNKPTYQLQDFASSPFSPSIAGWTEQSLRPEVTGIHRIPSGTTKNFMFTIPQSSESK